MSVFINKFFIGTINICIMLSLCACSYGGYNDSNIYLKKDGYNYYSSYINSQPEITFRSANTVRTIPDPNILSAQAKNPNNINTVVVESNTRSISITTPKNIPVLAETNTNRNFVDTTKQPTNTDTNESDKDQGYRYSIEGMWGVGITEFDLRIIPLGVEKMMEIVEGTKEFNDLMSQQNRNMTKINERDMKAVENYMDKNILSIVSPPDSYFDKVSKLSVNDPDFSKILNEINKNNSAANNTNTTNNSDSSNVWTDLVGPIMKSPDVNNGPNIAEQLDKLNSTVEKATENSIIETDGSSDINNFDTVNNDTATNNSGGTNNTDNNDSVDTNGVGGGDYSGTNDINSDNSGADTANTDNSGSNSGADTANTDNSGSDSSADTTNTDNSGSDSGADTTNTDNSSSDSGADTANTDNSSSNSGSDTANTDNSGSNSGSDTANTDNSGNNSGANTTDSSSTNENSKTEK